VNKPNSQLRLRVFAGPNGSGKSTVINSIRNSKENDRKLDFGVYINADDIAKAMNNDTFKFSQYKINCKRNEILSFASLSGLIMPEFTLEQLDSAIQINYNTFRLVKKQHLDRVSQIIARFLRETLLKAQKRFSFETVFSHESNLDIMKRAAEAGYKVYLYFVSTESPEINKYRVKLRVIEGGHDVPPDRIESRYYRSLDLIYDASEIAYQAFFFDNSLNDEPFKLVGHFKKNGKDKKWDELEEKDVAQWFKTHYLKKLKQLGETLPEFKKT